MGNFNVVKYEKFCKKNLLKVITARKQTFKTLMQHFGYVPAMHNTLKRLQEQGLIRVVEVFVGRQQVFFVKPDYKDSKIKPKSGLYSDRLGRAIEKRKEGMKEEGV